MSSTVSEKQAREVAEAARETEWKLPSFGKELFLGNFRLDLIHPQPQARARGGGEGRAVPDHAARRSSRTRSIRSRSSARRGSPTQVIDGLKRHRRVRDEGRRGVRRPGPLAGLLQPCAGDGRRLARRAVDAAQSPTSRSASPSRCGCSAPRSRSASGCRWWPRTTSARSCSPSPTSARTRRGWPRRPRRSTAATCSTAASCGRPTARSPTSSW